jgi:hypothetical protein
VYRHLFPEQQTSIRWFAYVEEPNGRCRVEEFIEGLTEEQRGKLRGRMIGWAKHGDWNANIPAFRRLQNTTPPIYEVKSHQERVLFIRCRNDAVAVEAFSKKGSTWGKKEDRLFAAAMQLFAAAEAECRRGPTYD